METTLINTKEGGPVSAAKTTASDALRHPIRVRILEALNTREVMSPVEFLRSGMMRGLPGLKGKVTRAQQMSHASYHFRQLAKAGQIEVDSTRPVRGSEEHFYRAKSRAYFTDAEWREMDKWERAPISKTMLTGFMAQAEGAMLSDTFDSRTDRWLAWIPFKVDQRAWDEMNAAASACYAEIEQIRHDAARRMQSSEGAEAAIPATFGIFTFESPPMGDSPPPARD
jgi:hypothetical protein